MNARHSFTLPYQPWSIDDHVASIDTEQLWFSRARDVIARGAKAVLWSNLDANVARDLEDAAEDFIALEGEDLGAFEDQWEAIDALVNPYGGYGLPDECAGWRGSSYASTWGMTDV